MRSIRDIFTDIAIGFVLILTLILGNIAQIMTLIIYPFSRRAFFRTNRELANAWWGLCVRIAGNMRKTPIVFHGDELDMLGNGIIITNHQSMTDILVIFELAYRQKRLGDLKWFVKQSVKWVPGVGWGMQFLNCIFVKRDWKRDENRIAKAFYRLVKSKIPFYMVIFPEGTRIKPAKVAESVRFSEEHGLPVMNKVLFPRTKGFIATVKGLRQQIDAIYDVTILYNDHVPGLWQWFRGDTGLINVFVKRYAKDDLPDDPDSLSDWLIQRYMEKDELLSRGYKDTAENNWNYPG